MTDQSKPDFTTQAMIAHGEYVHATCEPCAICDARKPDAPPEAPSGACATLYGAIHKFIIGYSIAVGPQKDSPDARAWNEGVTTAAAQLLDPEETAGELDAAVEAFAAHREAASLLPLKDACDRDWKDETPEQIISIAANAMYWRNEEIRKLRDQLADEKALGKRTFQAYRKSVEQLTEALRRLHGVSPWQNDGAYVRCLWCGITVRDEPNPDKYHRADCRWQVAGKLLADPAPSEEATQPPLTPPE